MNGIFLDSYAEFQDDRVPVSRRKLPYFVFKNQGALEVVSYVTDCLPCVLWKACRRDIKTLTSDRC